MTQLRNNHVWYRGYLIPEKQKENLERMMKQGYQPEDEVKSDPPGNEVTFGELKTGDKFKHNTFIFVKGGEDAGKDLHKFITDDNGPFINATCLSNYGWSAHFADHVKVKKIEDADEK